MNDRRTFLTTAVLVATAAAAMRVQSDEKDKAQMPLSLRARHDESYASSIVSAPNSILLDGMTSLSAPGTGHPRTFKGAGVSLALTSPAPGITVMQGIASSATIGVNTDSVGTYAPSGLGVCAAYFDYDANIPPLISSLSFQLTQASTTATISTNNIPRDGGMWVLGDTGDATAFAALSGAAALKTSYRAGQASPYGATVKPKHLVAHAKGIPTFILTADDCILEQYTQFFPWLDSRGLVGTFTWTPGLINGSNKYTTANAQAMHAAGMAFCCDSTANDSTTPSDPATAAAGILAVRSDLIANGLHGDGSENCGVWTFGNDVSGAVAQAVADAGFNLMRGVGETPAQIANSGYQLPALFTKHGFARGDAKRTRNMSFNAASTSADVEFCFNKNMQVGGTLFNLIHGPTSYDATALQHYLDLIATAVAAGNAQCLTMGQVFTRDGFCTLPLSL